ncbi:MAG: hypothetical protein DMF18_00335 [Verrucomicrobia bacterium]|jgi:hypothetical protein|nr:MAG: hypothetical protein DMF18_00335 [Verrucomicrobiota bacterium]
MKSIIRIIGCFLLSLASVTLVRAQASPAPAAADKAPAAEKMPARTDMYHVHFVKSSLGKAAALADALKIQDPKAPMPGHFIILRHESGESWDYAMISHLGTKAITEAVSTAPTAARDLQDWHDDTLVNGPPWADFVREMGLGDNAAKSTGSAYVLSVYRAAPGQRDQLEKMLSEPPDRPSDTSSGNVLMQHREGGAWTFLTIARYNSWQDYGTNESNRIGKTAKNQGGWFKLRDYISFHTDTATSRIAP